jgi:hypothetical protein
MGRITRCEGDAIFWGIYAMEERATDDLELAHRAWVRGDSETVNKFLGYVERDLGRIKRLEAMCEEARS